MSDATFLLFPSPQPMKFAEGDAVYVWLRSERDTGRARFLQYASDRHGEARVQVQFLCNDTTCHANPSRVIPVYLESLRHAELNTQLPLVLVTADTMSYRKLARSQTNRSDRVVEIGSSYGICTDILSQHCDSVMGLEISASLFVESQRRFPSLRFECVDVLSNSERVRTIMVNVNKVFVDIGGNRDAQSVIKILHFLITEFPQLELIVVKSKFLAASAASCIAAASASETPAERLLAGLIPAQWWPALLHLPEIVPTHEDDWFQCAKKSNFSRNPLRYPSRLTPAGVPICRVHNYREDGCQQADTCRYDHEVCHYCLGVGHKARDCNAC